MGTRLTIIILMIFGWVSGALAQVPLAFPVKSINAVLKRTLSNERVLVFGETHFSSLTFDKIADIVLPPLRSKGFDCLFLERPAPYYQRAYNRFMAGERYDDTILPVSAQLFGALKLDQALLGFDRPILERARSLGFRILAMDLSSVEEGQSSKLGEEAMLKREGRRNVEMAGRIAAFLSGACRRGVVVVGAWHVYGQDFLPTYNEKVKPIPALLGERGLKTAAYRLLHSSLDAKENLNVYEAVFR